jgi:hypothetical protein
MEKVVFATELVKRYRVKYLDGEKPYSIRSLIMLTYSALAAVWGSPLSWLVPDVMVPWAFVVQGLPQST